VIPHAGTETSSWRPNRGINDAPRRSDQRRQRNNEAAPPKKAIATPDSAERKNIPCFVAFLFLWLCTQLHRHDVGGCMRLERTGSHWPEAAQLHPSPPPRGFRVSSCPAMASSCRDHQGFLAVFCLSLPWGCASRMPGPAFLRALVAPKRTLTMEHFPRSDNGADVIGHNQQPVFVSRSTTLERPQSG